MTNFAFSYALYLMFSYCFLSWFIFPVVSLFFQQYICNVYKQYMNYPWTLKPNLWTFEEGCKSLEDAFLLDFWEKNQFIVNIRKSQVGRLGCATTWIKLKCIKTTQCPIKWHTDSKQYSCQKMEDIFQSGDFTLHMRTHTERLYPCNTCEKIFKDVKTVKCQMST